MIKKLYYGELRSLLTLLKKTKMSIRQRSIQVDLSNDSIYVSKCQGVVDRP